MAKYLKQNAIFCTGNHDFKASWLEPNGLVRCQAYSLLSIHDVELRGKTQTLVRIRNPYGEGEWNGPWCDGSSEWDTTSDDIKKSISYNQKEDGCFFMAFEDWIKFFEAFDICITIDDKAKTSG